LFEDNIIDKLFDVQKILDKKRNKGFLDNYEVNYFIKKEEGHIFSKTRGKEFFKENRHLFCVRISAAQGSSSFFFTKDTQSDLDRLLSIAIKDSLKNSNLLLFPLKKNEYKFDHDWDQLRENYSDFPTLKSNIFEDFKSKSTVFVNKEYIINSNGGYGNNLNYGLRSEQLMINKANSQMFRSFYSSTCNLNKNLYYYFLSYLLNNFSIKFSTDRYLRDIKVILSPYATIQLFQFFFPFIQSRNEKISEFMEEFVVINNFKQLKSPMYLGCDSEAVDPRESLILENGKIKCCLKTYTQSILDSEAELGTSVRSENGFLPIPSPRNMVIKTCNTEDIESFLYMKKTILIHMLKNITFLNSNFRNLGDKVFLVGVGFLKDQKLNESYNFLKVKLKISLKRFRGVLSSRKGYMIGPYYSPFLIF